MTEHDEEGYTGPATLLVGDKEVPVEVELRGYFQPIDGYYHWYGRVRESSELASLAGGKKTAARVRTPQGEAAAEVSDPDPWNRYRITGTSTPPFQTDLTA
ncbi:DUF4873 domain-containing protein [Kibdelosporangium philippinense]|uniref:DUF4873 domain-containing protein n=1 Tax=Kibdelosporangium philippinense TaxID=211113 RepID=A0ABS8ZLM8_9PSEU|nr:DUF4873 domain-containing protein [Kibdelosporangium philippinense]MCE7008407.1 DUF4873 domain-containing protein [Kibdelosporangium philippinense]